MLVEARVERVGVLGGGYDGGILLTVESIFPYGPHSLGS